jgi:alpha-1,2-mannosyltransferase
MVLAPAIAFLTADGFTRGFGPWQKTALAALWLVPLLTRSVAQASLIPLGVPAMLAVFALVMRYAGFGSAFGMAFAAAPPTMEPGPSGTARGHDIAAFKS